MARCTHAAGACDQLVCPRSEARQTADRRSLSHTDDLARRTRDHGQMCPCDACRELRRL